MMSSKRAYNWYEHLISTALIQAISLHSLCRYISLVAAACMVLYGYDASVYNTVQGSTNWVAYFNDPVKIHIATK